jgi:fucose permease
MAAKRNHFMTTSSADHKLLINAIILIALGVSILFLNSWDNLFVRASIGLFWGTFFLILNGPAALKTLRSLTKHNDNRRATYELTTQR